MSQSEMNNVINGKTEVYGLIGESVEYSLSPLIHNELARLTGVNSVYAAFSVRDKSAVGKALEGAYALGIKGMNITVPYKKSIIPFLSKTDENAEQVGAVNTIKYTESGYEGFNTDVYGVVKALEKHNVDLTSQSLLVLGAGGGAAAAVFAAALCGVRDIYIANRKNNNSELLARRVKKYYNNIRTVVLTFEDIPLIKGDYFIIQATPVGMKDSLSPVDNIEYIRNSTGVFDIIYSPLKTKILCDAESLGKPFFNGLDMLIFQAARAFEIWNGCSTDEHLYELYGRVLNTITETEEEK